ncbi:hypothetical protein ABDI30_11230 [Paenibacillus cisolokensis]|uniref:hypothetical protein n=1 Tax=Paenibacillus cisolokensis TaxID=1658519 RepID=UPI003D2C4799
MKVKKQYNTLEERELLIQEHSDLFLIEEHNIFEGNFLVFADEYPELPDPEPTLSEQVTELNQTVGNLILESANDKSTIASLENTVGSLLLEIAALKGGAE